MDIIDVRAIAHRFGLKDGHLFGDFSPFSFRRAYLLLTIISLYLSDLTRNRSDIISHDGFIVRTVSSLSVLTGSSEKTIYEDLNFLQKEGLLQKKKGFGTKLKVDVEEIFFFIDECKVDYLEWQKKELDKESAERHKTISDKKSRFEKQKNIIENIDADDFSKVSKIMNDVDAVFIYLFSHYYRAYTGQDYTWNLVKFNTMIENWRVGIYKPFPEYALSKALKDSLDDKSNRFLELKWRERFNPDSFQLADGIAFDSLMEAS